VARLLEVIQETKGKADISNDLRIYVEALQYFVSGKLAWSLTCPRYVLTNEFNEQQRERMKSASEDLPIYKGDQANVSNGREPSSTGVNFGNGVQTRERIPHGNQASSVHIISNADVAFNDHAVSEGRRGVLSNTHTLANSVAFPNKPIGDKSNLNADDIVLCQLSNITKEV
jgi:hypothetical protein